jgi:hypothetical protein
MKATHDVKGAAVEIGGEMHAFTQMNVNNAPDEFGVYALYGPGELLYVGRADDDSGTLRDWLQSHFSGAEGAGTKGAKLFRYEVTNDPASREWEVLDAYVRSHGGNLPRYNRG